MIEPNEVKQLIEQGIPGATAYVTDRGEHMDATVISEAFEDLSMLKQQQMVYATVNTHIASGALHALSIKAYTPAQWEARQP